MRKLDGKVAIVTGASRGIGAAIAERLAQDGASVVVNYVQAQRAAEEVAERVRRAGVRALVHKADIGDMEQAAGLVETAVKKLGRLDIVVNNAVVIDKAPLGKIDVGRLGTVFAANVEGVIATVQAALAHLPDREGRVISIGSLASTHALPEMSVYSATKGAIDALTRVWAKELGARGITVNAVAPGPVETDAMRENIDEPTRAFLLQRTPFGRIGAPSDIADVVAFLASPDARWVTGQVLAATGGFTP